MDARADDGAERWCVEQSLYGIVAISVVIDLYCFGPDVLNQALSFLDFHDLPIRPGPSELVLTAAPVVAVTIVACVERDGKTERRVPDQRCKARMWRAERQSIACRPVARSCLTSTQSRHDPCVDNKLRSMVLPTAEPALHPSCYMYVKMWAPSTDTRSGRASMHVT